MRPLFLSLYVVKSSQLINSRHFGLMVDHRQYLSDFTVCTMQVRTVRTYTLTGFSEFLQLSTLGLNTCFLRTTEMSMEEVPSMLESTES